MHYKISYQSATKMCKKGVAMKFKNIAFLCIVASYSHAGELPKEPQERIEEMAKEGYNRIDVLFERAHQTIVDKKTIMEADWWMEKQDVADMKNILSDAYIEFFCDQSLQNPIQPLMADYVYKKIGEEVPKVFSLENVSEKSVKDFYTFAYVLLELNQVKDAPRLVSRIKEENADKLLSLRFQKQIKAQGRKEQRRNLAEAIILGIR